MGFDLGSFAGGIGQGMQQGADIRRRMMERAQQLRDLKAQANAQDYFAKGPISGVPGVGGPPPQPPAPAQGGGGGTAGPAPPMAPPQAPGGMPGPQRPPMPPAGPMAAPQGMPSAAAPAPKPPGPPAAPGAPPAPQQGAGGVVQPQLPQDTQRKFQDLMQQIAAQNPGKKWGKTELLDTAMAVVKDADSMNPMEKILTQAQIAYMKVLAHHEEVQETNETRQGVADTQAGARMYGSDKGLEGREYAADKGLTGREYAADKGLTGREYSADKGLEGRQVAAAASETVGAGHDAASRANTQDRVSGAERIQGARGQNALDRERAKAILKRYPTAKLAPDGDYYMPDPKRPGKYLKVG